MKLEQRLKRYYVLRDTAEALLWSPILATGLVFTVGFHIYDRPRIVSSQLEAVFDATQYVVVASPAGTLLGLLLFWKSKQSAAQWQAEDLRVDAENRTGVSRLGAYKLKRVFSHRERGIQLTRFRLSKPLRVTFNSAITAFLLMLAFVEPARVKSQGGPLVSGDIWGYAVAMCGLMCGLAGGAVWVNRRWVCEAIAVDGGYRVQMTSRSGFIRSRAFHQRQSRGPLNVRSVSNCVVIFDGERELSLMKLSSGALGQWEAVQLASVIREATGMGAGSRR